MNFYLVFTLIFGAFVLFGIKNRGVGYLLFILLFFLAAFRGANVGSDTEDYISVSTIEQKAFYADMSNLEFDDLGSRIELLNNFAYKLISIIGGDGRLILVFYASLMLFSLYKAFKRFGVNVVYGVSFFVILEFFFISFCYSRQLCAVGILLYAFSFLMDKGTRSLWFFVFVLLATSIHSFSIFCFLLYLVKYIPIISKRNSIIIFLICILLIFLDSISLTVYH